MRIKSQSLFKSTYKRIAKRLLVHFYNLYIPSNKAIMIVGQKMLEPEN